RPVYLAFLLWIGVSAQQRTPPAQPTPPVQAPAQPELMAQPTPLPTPVPQPTPTPEPAPSRPPELSPQTPELPPAAQPSPSSPAQPSPSPTPPPPTVGALATGPDNTGGMNSLHGLMVESIQISGPSVEHPEWLDPLLTQKVREPLDKYKVRESVQA